MSKDIKLPYSVNDNYVNYRKPLERKDWPYKATTSGGIDTGEIKPLERDYSKCDACGGVGRYWGSSCKKRLGRSRLVQCNKCK